MLTSNEEEVISLLFRKLQDIEDRLDRVETGSRSSQLGNSSIDLAKGPGYIPAFDENGIERFRFGRMPDGTVTSKSVNNPDPPPPPNNFLVQPIIGGLMVAVEDLQAAIPYDFGYLRVYVDGMIDGTISEIPGIWISAPLDTNTTHSVKVVAVNQSGKESTFSTEVVAKPLSVLDEIDPGSITATQIADDSISTPKLKALSITAAKIAAQAIDATKIAVNAVEADAIKAGSVTASKLAAQIILAEKEIIAGNPAGERVVINSKGLQAFSKLGQLLISIGSGGAIAGNVWTVVDANSPNYTLATLGSDGTLSIQSLSVLNEPVFQGLKLSEFLQYYPKGLQSFCSLDLTGVQIGSTNYGMMELSFRAEVGRMYRISLNNFRLDPASKDGVGYVEMRLTEDGSKPTIANSKVWNGSFVYAYQRTQTSLTRLSAPGGTDGHTHQYADTYPYVINDMESFYWTTDQNRSVRLLICARAAWANSLINFQGFATLSVEDVGPYVDATGGRVDGSSTGPSSDL